MKKFLTIICFALCLMLTSSCEPYAQVSCNEVNGFYTEYYYNNMPVVIINGAYYYRIYSGTRWLSYPVPRTSIRYVYRYDRPRYYTRSYYNRPRHAYHSRQYTPRHHVPSYGRSSTRITGNRRGSFSRGRSENRQRHFSGRK